MKKDMFYKYSRIGRDSVMDADGCISHKCVLVRIRNNLECETWITSVYSEVII